MRQEGSEKWIAVATAILYEYIALKWIFVRFPLFVPHTNPHFWTDRTTLDVTSASTLCHLRLPPPFQRHISFAKWLHRLASPHGHVRVCVANTRVYMRLSSGRLSTCFVLSARSRVCVFTAALLHIPDISFFAIHMGPSQRASSSPPTHVCVFVCLSTPAWLHLPDISIFAIATHSISHMCTLSNTHFCSCIHCQYYEVPFPDMRQ